MAMSKQSPGLISQNSAYPAGFLTPEPMPVLKAGQLLIKLSPFKMPLTCGRIRLLLSGTSPLPDPSIAANTKLFTVVVNPLRIPKTLSGSGGNAPTEAGSKVVVNDWLKSPVRQGLPGYYN